MYFSVHERDMTMPMTISQALRRISKLKHEAKEQFDRAASAVLHDASAPPAFTFTSSHELANSTIEELIKLETQLRVTNATTAFEWSGRKLTLAEATCRLQEMRGKIAWLKALPTQTQAERVEEFTSRALYDQTLTTTKKTTLCALPEAKRAEWIKKTQDEFDTLNDAVESVNHRTTLV